MFCVIYRSSKRDQTYLYVEKKDDFSRVPDELTEQGYYLQLPPPPEDLLKQHLSVMGQKTDDTNK